MKHLAFLLFAITSLTSFSQVPDTTLKKFYKTLWTSGNRTLTIHPGLNGDYDTLAFDIRMRPKQDIIRAELLVTFTSRRWGVAHARPGYVVKRGDRVVGYLSDSKRRFPPQATVWRWKEIGGGK